MAQRSEVMLRCFPSCLNILSNLLNTKKKKVNGFLSISAGECSQWNYYLEQQNSLVFYSSYLQVV